MDSPPDSQFATDHVRYFILGMKTIFVKASYHSSLIVLPRATTSKASISTKIITQPQPPTQCRSASHTETHVLPLSVRRLQRVARKRVANPTVGTFRHALTLLVGKAIQVDLSNLLQARQQGVSVA